MEIRLGQAEARIGSLSGEIKELRGDNNKTNLRASANHAAIGAALVVAILFYRSVASDLESRETELRTAALVADSIQAGKIQANAITITDAAGHELAQLDAADGCASLTMRMADDGYDRVRFGLQGPSSDSGKSNMKLGDPVVHMIGADKESTLRVSIATDELIDERQRSTTARYEPHVTLATNNIPRVVVAARESQSHVFVGGFGSGGHFATVLRGVRGRGGSLTLLADGVTPSETGLSGAGMSLEFLEPEIPQGGARSGYAWPVIRGVDSRAKGERIDIVQPQGQ